MEEEKVRAGRESPKWERNEHGRSRGLPTKHNEPLNKQASVIGTVVWPDSLSALEE